MDRRGFITVGAAGVASMTLPQSSAFVPARGSAGVIAPQSIGGAPAPGSQSLLAATAGSSDAANLKEAPYLAAGDGVTDDTAAVQMWLTDISQNRKTGVVPPGNYKLTAPVTAARGDFWRIVGHGRYASAFFYAGANTDVNIFEIGSATANSNAVQIKGISIFSYYDMSGGFALKANRLANSSITDVTFGGELYANYTANGVWLNGAHQVFLTDFDCQTKGDGIRVNGIDLQSCSDLYLDHGYSTNNGVCGVRCAGGFGGLYLDEVETLANGTANLIIDNSQPSAALPGNREIILGANYIADGVHTVSSYGIYIDDPAASGGTVVSHGFIGSSRLHGVYIKTWPQSSFVMGAGRIFNNLQDGVRVDDASTYVVLGDGVSIDNNRGWGVQSVQGSENARISAQFASNHLGDISEKIGSWRQHTPTAVPQSGSFQATCEVHWSAEGKTIHFSGQVVIVDNQTAGGSVVVPLPVPARANSVQVCSGRADAVSGKMLQGVIRGGSLTLVAYDNTYPGQTGERLCFSGTYEAAYLNEGYR